MKKFFGEFEKFITRGNIVDMSVGVIVGGAFTGIVNGLTNNILKPLINWFLSLILGSNSLSEVYTYLKIGYAADGTIDLANSIYIDWGAFINAIINFLIIAVVLFSIVKIFNQINEASKKIMDMKAHIAFKQEKGLKLTKKEAKFLELEAIKEQEAKIQAEEEAKKAEEEAKKLTRSEALLTEIVELLKNK
jgi:large conductance mechanosensitive channel